MLRALPLVAMQVPPRSLDEPVDGFGADVAAVLADYPQSQMVIYPELHLHGTRAPADPVSPDSNARLAESAQPLTGPRVSTLAEIAGDLGVWLVPGTVCERGSDGELYNTAVVFSPQGQLVASYRKIFPWRPYEPYRPGNRFVTFDIAGLGRVGLSICYDSWFPELTRHLAWMGAEVVLNLVKTTTADRAQELVLARANAIVNQVFVVSVNVGAPVGAGQSVIVDPEGLVRLAAPSESPMALTDVLDFGHVERVRRYGTAGLNRMWDQFHADDEPLSLPLYDGSITAERWNRPPTDCENAE